MRSTDAYRKALRKQARRDTKRLLRKAAPGTTLSLTIWSREHQDAYLDAGWTPISESPRIDPLTKTSWSEMTMTLTKAT